MTEQRRISVSPQTLIWARETAGYTQEAAAKKIGCSLNSYRLWESGDLKPTVKQLRDAAGAFGRAFATMLMPSPPDEAGLPVTDFRRRRADGKAQPWTPAVIAAARRALHQRETLIDLQQSVPEAVHLNTSNFALTHNDPETLGSELREQLRLADLPKAVLSNGPRALNAVTVAAERLGVMVTQVQRVPHEEMRGMSIAEFPFPIAALNGSEFPRPKLYTLLHELAHIGLRLGGVCDLHDQAGTNAAETDRIEHHCNRIAAAALMPQELFLAAQHQVGGAVSGWSIDDLRELGARFGASSEAALLRLITLGVATWDTYHLRKPELDAAYRNALEQQKRESKETEGGPSYYVMKVRDLGHPYVRSVYDAFASDAISSRDVSVLLGVRFDQLPKLLEVAGR